MKGASKGGMRGPGPPGPSRIPNPGRGGDPNKSGRPSLSRTSTSTAASRRPQKHGQPGELSAAKVALNPDKSRARPSKPTSSKIEITSTKLEPKFQLPAMSTIKKQGKKLGIDKEKLRKQMYRRLAPEGEDIAKLKEVLKSIKGEEVSVQEFIGLVSPYTADQGDILRQVFAEDVNSFHIMAKKIYDTMTRDVSDVLTNEHIQLLDMQNEKYEYYTHKMMKSIDDIFELCPDFDFEKYYANPAEYLGSKFALPKEVVADPEEEEMQLRQEAYHRLQWLRSEGERLAQENSRLQARLKQLKEEQKRQVQKAEMIEDEAEDTKAQLENAEATLQARLDDLNQSIDRSMVMEESAMRRKVDSANAKLVKQTESKRIRSKGPAKREGWSKKAASEIEAEAAATTMTAEVSKVSLSATASRPKVLKKKSKSRMSATGATSPFHFSPIKTPPQQRGAARPASPFHYSPPKTPPGYYQDEGPSLQQMQTTRVEKTTTSTETAPPRQPPTRPSRAPRDSWGGFY